MTHKERFMTALRREQPDMVPIWEMGINEVCIIDVAAKFTSDLPPRKYMHELTPADLLRLFKTYMDMVEELDMDGFTVPTLTGRETLSPVLIRDKLGIVSHVSSAGEPFPIEGPVGSAADLDTHLMPEPDDTFLFAAFLAKQRFKNDRAIVLHSPGTFKLSWALRGKMETLLADFILEPDFAHRMARMTTDYCMKLFKKAAAAGVDAIILEGDLAMNETTLMSPAHYREFVKPYHTELVAAAHAAGCLIAKHSDGNLWPILDDLLEAGFDGIHPIQPQCMDIGEVKKHLSGRAAVLGNIDCMGVLVYDTPADVEKAVEETIRIAASGGGYILSSSNSIHPDVKPENFIAQCRAARKYGKY